MIVRMWEARAEAYGVADLITWVCDTALPELEHDPLHVSSEVFSSTDHRVVVISKWRSNPGRCRTHQPCWWPAPRTPGTSPRWTGNASHHSGRCLTGQLRRNIR